MKKVFLLVAVFLVGITTQTFAQHRKNVVYNPGTYDRYYNSQEIRFVADGVLYTVTTYGSFQFREINKPYQYSNSSRGYNAMYYPSTPGAVTYVKHRHGYRSIIRTNRAGRIRSIGRTLITYQRNGKVRSIGRVSMHYHHGKLVRIGNMKIRYNHRGMIMNTIGHVNGYNKKAWHDDWYTYDNDWDDDFNRKRKRKKH